MIARRRARAHLASDKNAHEPPSTAGHGKQAMGKVTKEAGDIAALMFELIQAGKRTFQTIAREHGLTPQQAATLYNLEPGQGLPMSALAELLMCDASNVTGIVDKLEARGLARREQAEDRRVKVLTLTAQGEALRATLRGQALAPQPWVIGLTRDEQRALRDLLQRAVSLLQPPGDKLGMFYALSKTLDLAFSPVFVPLAVALVGARALGRGRRRLGHTLLALAGLLLYLPSTGAVARLLMAQAERFDGPEVVPHARYDAVLLLGGFAGRGEDRRIELSESADRLVRAWELLRDRQAERIVIAAGSVDPNEVEADLAAELLTGMGADPAALLLDRTSRNTRENALEIRKLVDAHGLKRLVVVTSAFHMQRALDCLRAVDLYPDALATDHRVPPWHGSFDAVAPRAASLALSEVALREMAGRVVYRLRGYAR